MARCIQVNQAPWIEDYGATTSEWVHSHSLTTDCTADTETSYFRQLEAKLCRHKLDNAVSLCAAFIFYHAVVMIKIAQRAARHPSIHLFIYSSIYLSIYFRGLSCVLFTLPCMVSAFLLPLILLLHSVFRHSLQFLIR